VSNNLENLSPQIAKDSSILAFFQIAGVTYKKKVSAHKRQPLIIDNFEQKN